ncbi:hypothetical protein D8674_014221 [Pyrus ussuriensis x Pyrus communis]|uniref:Uncharacterized protein n=1 Tax=Pyrus ussuriensis x Pyrus communis TaxID=2448454 RepID=A0A5N5GXB8_9ROSA|nr:hypothetical protein D8674_014221 [Pyrus ussuriensis x Pyrus communis]
MIAVRSFLLRDRARIASRHASGGPEALSALEDLPQSSEATSSLDTASQWVFESDSKNGHFVSAEALNPLRAYLSLPQVTFGPKRFSLFVITSQKCGKLKILGLVWWKEKGGRVGWAGGMDFGVLGKVKGLGFGDGE